MNVPASSGPSDSIVLLCQELVGCVSRILDPYCPPEERAACTQKIEQFKEENPHCMQCGFLLIVEQDPTVKHFGLQLIEHCVKYRWQSLEQEEFRLNMLEYMTNSAHVTDQETHFNKESLARVMVEIAKMSWPQKWGSFITDMDTLASAGLMQLELVLLIFRRLSEDVHIYNSDLTAKRKKEMTAALNEHAKVIFKILLQKLETPPTNNLRSVALSAITSFAEWTDFTILLMEKCKLLVLLYNMIGMEELKTAACECLLIIVSRKYKGDIKRTAEERTKLLILLSKEALDGILKASIKANSHEGVVEEQYVFLKRICQVLVHLGVSQLGQLWVHQPGFQKPDTFEEYLKVVIEFTRHPSQLLSLTSFEVWTCFINHNHIKEEKTFKDFLPLLLTVMRIKFSKYGDPNLTGHINSEYSRLDFDGLEEYTLFFSQYRSKLYKVVHQLCQMNPRTAANEALVVLQELVQRKADDECTRCSPLFIDWDGYVGYLECWAHSLKTDHTLREIQVVKEKCQSVLMCLLKYETQDALLLQCQFKCLQSAGLLVFLGFDQTLFQLYIQKVFSSIGYMGDCIDKNNLPKEVVAVRNLTITCFVHLCETQTELMAPFLEVIYEQYKSLVEKDTLVNAEKCSFMESLVMLSLKKYDLLRQFQFIGELLQEVIVVSQQIEKCVKSAASVIENFGLSKNLIDRSDPGLLKSKKLCFVVRSILLILKRMGPSSDKPHNHPAYAHVMPLVMQCCVPYLQAVYEVWSSSHLLGEHFKIISQLHPNEKDTVLGKTMFRRTEQMDYGVASSIQMHLITAHDDCMQTIARVCSLYGVEHMHSLGILTGVQQAMLTNIASLHFWRLRNVLRFLIIPIVSLCAEESSQDMFLVSYLLPLCQHVFTVLQESWHRVAERRMVTADVHDSEERSCNESEEMLQEQLTIFLSREYSTLLELICVKKVNTGRKGKQTEDNEDIAMMEDDTEEDVFQQGSENALERSLWSLFQVLTPLGKRLLQTTQMCELLLLSSFTGITWSDSQSCVKCINVAGLLYTEIPIEHFSSDVHERLFTQVLIALQINGASDHIRNPLSFLAMLIYQSTFTKGYCPNIQSILSRVPETNPSKIEEFNRLLAEDPPTTIRVKKEKFRDLVSGVIGKHVGEEFKRPVVFDLPEMEFKKKSKRYVSETVTNLSTLFETSDS